MGLAISPVGALQRIVGLGLLVRWSVEEAGESGALPCEKSDEPSSDV